MAPRTLTRLHTPLRALSRPTVLSRPLNALQSRQASTAATDARSLVTRLKNLLYGTSIIAFSGLVYLYSTDTRAGVHQWLVVPSLRWVFPDAEDAHHAGTQALKTLYQLNMHPRERGDADAKGDLSVRVFGERLRNPIGTSAGIDKLAEIPDALLALGGAIVEIGGVTPLAQGGNPKPRVFRLPDWNGLINRYGLNSEGADAMVRRLRERVRLFAIKNNLGAGEAAERRVLDGEAGVPPGSLMPGKLMLVQVAKAKQTPEGDIEAVKQDYVTCVEKLAKYADVLVVNVSSPNTPGLRSLQAVEPLTNILKGVVDAAQSTDRKTKPRVMVKVSPDEDEDTQVEGIVEAVWRSGVDGIIVGNTTKRRDGLIPEGHKLSLAEKQVLEEQGGYSGPQMFQRTLSLVKRYRTLLDQGPPSHSEETSEESKSATSGDEAGSTITEKIHDVKEAVVRKVKKEIESYSSEPKVIFATGGITNGKQALEVLNAGASVVQVYTAVIYGGTGTITRIKKEMREEIKTAGEK